MPELYLPSKLTKRPVVCLFGLHRMAARSSGEISRDYNFVVVSVRTNHRRAAFENTWLSKTEGISGKGADFKHTCESFIQRHYQNFSDIHIFLNFRLGNFFQNVIFSSCYPLCFDSPRYFSSQFCQAMWQFFNGKKLFLSCFSAPSLYFFERGRLWKWRFSPLFLFCGYHFCERLSLPWIYCWSSTSHLRQRYSRNRAVPTSSFNVQVFVLTFSLF